MWRRWIPQLRAPLRAELSGQYASARTPATITPNSAPLTLSHLLPFPCSSLASVRLRAERSGTADKLPKIASLQLKQEGGSSTRLFRDPAGGEWWRGGHISKGCPRAF